MSKNTISKSSLLSWLSSAPNNIDVEELNSWVQAKTDENTTLDDKNTIKNSSKSNSINE